jgi:hypothetical protein
VTLDDRYANKFTPFNSTTIYPKLGHKLLYTPMTREMKCPIGYTSVLRIPFHLLQCWCNTCTNHITNDMIHFISSRDLVGSSISTLLAFHSCFGPSVPSHHSTCSSRLQPIYQVKSCLDLLHLSPWLHVISHMQWAPSSHVWALQHIQSISPPWLRLLTHNVLVD